ncbi:MAG: glycosyltransferase family 1 protein [Chloroflexota bacterium]
MSGRLFINGRFLTHLITGVQRYARELMRAWDEWNPDVELVCLAPPEDFERPTWKNIALKIIGKNRGNAWEQVDLPLWLKGRFLFSPANIGPAFYANQVVTMHDASVFAAPEAYSRAFQLKYRFAFRQLAKRVRRIFTDSVFSQRELAYWLRRPAGRFEVVPLGGDHLQRLRSDESVLDKHGLRGMDFMLMVANQGPHKNMRRALDAANQLRGRETRFVLAGGRFKAVFQSARAGSLPSNVVQVGYVGDAELKALYEHARGFIVPSLYEGFGLPVLEAMNCGCPVLSSRAASLPEVGGDAAMYFDPLDANDIASKLERFISDPNRRAEWRERGKRHAAQFTWDRTARRTMDLLTPYFSP